MPSPEKTEPARSWLDDALPRFDRDNADLVTPTRTLLEGIVAAPARHARMINTLSLLEHMGSHKIMATQHSAAIDQATLRHVAEEAHHAYFMKRQAEKVAARALEYVDEDLLAPTSARMYFQRLEAKMKRALSTLDSERAVYLYMSMIVEFRALWFYHLYQDVLQKARHALSLKRVLGEEANHLSEIAGRLDERDELNDTHAAELLGFERKLFARFLGELERAAA